MPGHFQVRLVIDPADAFRAFLSAHHAVKIHHAARRRAENAAGGANGAGVTTTSRMGERIKSCLPSRWDC